MGLLAFNKLRREAKAKSPALSAQTEVLNNNTEQFQKTGRGRHSVREQNALKQENLRGVKGDSNVSDDTKLESDDSDK